MALWAELKRRKVVQVAAVYAVTAWLAVQVVSAINEPLRLPEWLDTVVIVLLAVGFPIALILAWAFDLGPGGVRAGAPGRANEGASQASAPTFTYVIQGLVLLAVGFLVADQYLFESSDAASPVAPDTSSRPHVTRFSVPVLSGSVGASGGTSDVAVDRNGEHFAYSVQGAVYVRPIRALEPELILENQRFITQMTSSPDGDWLAYFDPGPREIRRVAISGGSSVLIARLDTEISSDQIKVFDMTWAPDGMLRFAVAGGIYAVPADGSGSPDRIVAVEDGLVPFRPQLLPDGDTLLFSIAPNGRWDDGEIVAQSLTSGERKLLVAGGTNAHFVDSGHLVYALGSSIYAVAFDPESLEVSGNAVEVADNVLRGSFVWLSGAALFDISSDGTLVYMRGIQEPRRQLVWVDRAGGEELIPAEPRNYEGLRLSPDGNRLVVNEFNTSNDIWIWDFAAETMMRLQLGENGGDAPVWTPDGGSIAYHPSTGTFADIRASNNTGDPLRLFTAATGALDPVHPSEFVPNGDQLLFFGRSDAGNEDIGLAELNGSDEYEWIVSTSASELTPRLSPGARWLAYTSDETGRSEVYVAPFPNVDDGRWQVSNRGGDSPVWSPDGSALYYIEPGEPPRMIEVDLSEADNAAGAEFRFGERVPLFDWPYWMIRYDSAFDVNADSTRFVAIKLLEDESDDVDIVVVQNWFEELSDLVPSG